MAGVNTTAIPTHVGFPESCNKRGWDLKAFGKSECLEAQMSELMRVLGTRSSSAGLHPQEREINCWSYYP